MGRAQFGQYGPKDDKPGPFKRAADGKPDLSGLWLADTLAPFDVEDHEAVYGIPAGKGVVVDPPDRKIPYQPFLSTCSIVCASRVTTS